VVRKVLGIEPDEAGPGYRRFSIRPRPGGGLEWARGSYDSIRGRIAVEWRIDGGDLRLDCTVPANATAMVAVPAASAGAGTLMRAARRTPNAARTSRATFW
jgi:alpha-L-rhamnosidase